MKDDILFPILKLIALFGVLIVAGVLALDVQLSPAETVPATVQAKILTPGHWKISDGVTYVPDKFQIVVKTATGDKSLEVSKDIYDKAERGGRITLTCHTGRITGNWSCSVDP